MCSHYLIVKVQKLKNLPKFPGLKCRQTTPIWWEIWGSKTPKVVSCTKLGMLFQNDALMSKLKELTKISGGKVWSDRPKLTIIVCHLIRIDLPNYYSLYYLGWLSEMFSTAEKSYFKGIRLKFWNFLYYWSDLTEIFTQYVKSKKETLFVHETFSI